MNSVIVAVIMCRFPLEESYRTDSQGPSLNWILFHITTAILIIFSFQHSFSSRVFIFQRFRSQHETDFGFQIASRRKKNRMTMTGTIHFSKYPLWTICKILNSFGTQVWWICDSQIPAGMDKPGLESTVLSPEPSQELTQNITSRYRAGTK